MSADGTPFNDAIITPLVLIDDSGFPEVSPITPPLIANGAQIISAADSEKLEHFLLADRSPDFAILSYQVARTLKSTIRGWRNARRCRTRLMVYGIPADLRYDPELLKDCDYWLADTENMAVISAVAEAGLYRCGAAMRLRDDVRNRNLQAGDIITASFEVQDLDEAKNLATMLSLTCENAGDVAVGLVELIVNGIEHGNLEIGYELKGSLLRESAWRAEIEKRLATSPYRERRVRVTFERDDGFAVFNVKDEGQGFNPATYLVPKQSASHSLHGRGVYLSKTILFEDLQYTENGTRATARARLKGKSDSSGKPLAATG